MKWDECRETLTHKVQENWFNESVRQPEFLPVYSKADRKENEKRISQRLSRIQKQMNRFPRFPGGKKRWKNHMEQLLYTDLWTEPLLSMENAMTRESAGAFAEAMKDLVRRARRFDPTLPIEALGQALRNYMLYALFCELNGLPQKCTTNIFGYSMLYPYTDNYMDTPGISGKELGRYNQLIADQIRGERFHAVTEHDRKTAELLSLAEASYERPDDIYEGLLLMLEAQRNSQKQNDRENPLTADETLEITFLKGGVSVLLDRYLIGLPLTEEDFEFYYELGALLQMCDDLQDIAGDRKSGCQTIFSGCRSKEETVRNVNRLLHRMKRLFDSHECVREKFKEILRKDCLLLILTSAAESGQYMTEEWLVWLEERLPVSTLYLQEIRKTCAAEMFGGNQRKLMKMVDALITSCN